MEASKNLIFMAIIMATSAIYSGMENAWVLYLVDILIDRVGHIRVTIRHILKWST